MEEQRKYRRLALRLPMECRVEGSDRSWRALTTDVGTGGVYFEVQVRRSLEVPATGERVQLNVTIPPGEGYSPYHGRLSGLARVVRHQQLAVEPAASGFTRYGIAAQFDRPIHLAF